MYQLSINLQTLFYIIILLMYSCRGEGNKQDEKQETGIQKEEPKYFLLRPALEKEFGYSHAVQIGNILKISGAVSMDERGNILDAGNMEQQMKNCYQDLEKILNQHGYTFDHVVSENIYTTDMDEMSRVAGFRHSIYKKQFPTGTWLEVKGLAAKGLMIEIEMEAYK